ncbi:hypothetical protein [Sphingomonas aracearum]|uniref:Uncharacterized protein n=1 Tax=Sphingomonas aracearum TaxID=2283317 RepID=A0A369VX88_9SPHN|nr:hypothetical protein [Sphingomonas aracearum]RDE06996.1 hypothetical protein DVW87_04870 [Sphingomonas aracearum]
MKLTIAVSLALAGLAPQGVAAQSATLTPAQAVAAAAAPGAGPVSGTFEFQVGSTGASGYDVYLNSDADYHAATNLTVVLHAEAVNALTKQLGGHPADMLTGKRIRVTGAAQRVAFPRRDGTQTFQTRIEVATADQIRILQ